MIRFTHQGDLKKTENFLTLSKNRNFRPILDKYGQEGVNALAANTPKDTGRTADSWGYEVSVYKGGFKLFWTNSNLVEGVPVVILLQYGHASRSGRFVAGQDFINPAIKPIFDTLAENLWKEVTSL